MLILDQFGIIQSLQMSRISQTSNWSSTFFAVSCSKPALVYFFFYMAKLFFFPPFFSSFLLATVTAVFGFFLMMTRKVITLENFQADFDCKIPTTIHFSCSYSGLDN